MAWRPTEYLLEGELNNTNPGKVTGWMKFAGMNERVTFDLEGNFHRDIRGAKIRFTGNGWEGDPKAPSYMYGIAEQQTGEVGDITAGLPPFDYTKYPYLEVYTEQNGRIVIELSPDQLEVIGRPIPVCESDPISRKEQGMKMARFIAGLSQAAGALAVAPGAGVCSDPTFSHWVIEQGQIIGEARSVEKGTNGTSFAFVRLFSMPEMAEYGSIPAANLLHKNGAPCP